MADEPYGARPAAFKGGTELSRLAAEGQRRILEADAARAAAAGPDEARRDRNVRVALGGYYGAPVHTVAYVLMAASVTVLAGALFVNAAWVAVLWPPLVAALVLRLAAAPTATRARVAAEQAWVTGLPFTLDGYFQALAEEPRVGMRLVIELTWREGSPHPDPQTVQGILGVVDAEARIEANEPAGVRIHSGRISGDTRLRSNEGIVARNTRIVGYVHALVDRALQPLHRACPLARASVARR